MIFAHQSFILYILDNLIILLVKSIYVNDFCISIIYIIYLGQFDYFMLK